MKFHSKPQRRTQQVVQVGLGLPRFWPNKLTDQLEVQPTSPFGGIPTPLPDGPSNHSSFTHASTAPGSRATRRPNARRECATGEQDFCICSRYSSSPPCHAARSRRHEPMTLERQAAVKLARAVSLVHLFPASECKLQAWIQFLIGVSVGIVVDSILCSQSSEKSSEKFRSHLFGHF